MSRAFVLKSCRPVSLAGSHPPAMRSVTAGNGCEKLKPVSKTMNHDDKIDSQRITVGMRDRVEAISWDADQINVLLEVAHDQVFTLKKFLEDTQSIAAPMHEWRVIFALINLSQRELERIKGVSEDFANLEFKDGIVKKVASNG